VLRGKIEAQRFHGTWSFIGYAGPTIRGHLKLQEIDASPLLRLVTMSKIRVLPDHLSNLIAAGEVVRTTCVWSPKNWSKTRSMRARRASSSMSNQVDAGC
jgi:hypothetical protein